MSEKWKGLFTDYFKMSEAVDDVKYSYGAKDKTVSAKQDWFGRGYWIKLSL